MLQHFCRLEHWALCVECAVSVILLGFAYHLRKALTYYPVKQKHAENGLQIHNSHSLNTVKCDHRMGDAVGFGARHNGHKGTNVLNCHILLNQDYSRRKSSIKLCLKNSNPNGLKFSSVIWLNRQKKERKKTAEEKRERRDALLITEPSAESWMAANSTGSWDRGMGEGERKGRAVVRGGGGRRGRRREGMWG